jgi:hypothetical protein
VSAFDAKGQRYPIDSDDARAWLHFGRNDNALKTFKYRFQVVTDHDFGAGGVLRDQEGSFLCL